MDIFTLRIIETAVVVILYFVLRAITNRSVKKVAQKFDYHKPRVSIVANLITTSVFLICAGIILSIWGVNHSELLIFLTTVLTILGVAFFAQWSILSNITAALIIYFKHPSKIGDNITVLDKEYNIEGTIYDIGLFFITIKTLEGQFVSIPSNVFMQKMTQRSEMHRVVESSEGNAESDS